METNNPKVEAFVRAARPVLGASRGNGRGPGAPGQGFEPGASRSRIRRYSVQPRRFLQFSLRNF